MKKVLSFILMAVAVMMFFVSCDDPAHEHSFEVVESSEKLVKKCTYCGHVSDEEITGTLVSTAESFKTALSEDKTIYLGDDIDLANDSNLEIKDKKKVEIDLNGKTLTVKKRIFITNAKVTLAGKGTLKTTATGGDTSVIWLYGDKDNTNAKDYTVLTVGNGITIEGQRGICVNNIDNVQNQASYGVVVNLNGTTFNTEFACLYIQGRCTVATGNVPVFNIKDVKIKQTKSSNNTSDDPVGIYGAGYGVWNIENTTVEGVNSAVEIRAGELNIKSGTFTASATPASFDANGNGTTSKGTAIAVAQHTTNLPIAVKISGGEFSGYHALTVMNPQNNSSESCKKVSVTVTGGAFSSTSNQTIVNVADSFALSENPTYTSPASFSVNAKETQ